MQFSRIDQLVIDTCGLSTQSALTYLKDHGVKKSESWYFKKKKKLEQNSYSILFETAKNFHALHLRRVSTLRYLLDVSFKNLKEESDPIKRQRIIDSIKELQYDIATFDEATRDLIEEKTGIPVSEQEEEIATR